MSTAERIAGTDFQRWLRYKNAHGSDVYLSLNSFKDHAQSRTKADFNEIRHLHLDLDQNGSTKLAAIAADDYLPQPNYVLNTSPDKYQVVWKVAGFGQDEAEILLRALAQRYGGDPAATDSTRVFRLPGFSNKKYEQDFQVTFTREAPSAVVYHSSDFIARGVAQAPEGPSSQAPARSLDRPGNSQSEKDWAYAIRKLKEGEDPEKIIRDMARYRSVDHYDKKDPAKVIAPRKANARYYVDRTVTQAMAQLGIPRGPPQKPSGETAGTSGERGIEPSR